MSERHARCVAIVLLALGALMASTGCRSALNGEWLGRTSPPPPRPSGMDRLDYPEMCFTPRPAHSPTPAALPEPTSGSPTTG
jgi:hypothetical protein